MRLSEAARTVATCSPPSAFSPDTGRTAVLPERRACGEGPLGRRARRGTGGRRRRLRGQEREGQVGAGGRDRRRRRQAGPLAVAVVRPRGVAASGKVVLTLTGKAKGVKTFAAALDGGKAPRCPDLAALLGKRLKGSADVKALGGVLAAKLCGKARAGRRRRVLTQARARARAPAQPAPGARPARRRGRSRARRAGTAARRRRRPHRRRPPAPAGERAATTASTTTATARSTRTTRAARTPATPPRTARSPVSAECAASSGVGMGDDPTALVAGINPAAGCSTRSRSTSRPGVALLRDRRRRLRLQDLGADRARRRHGRRARRQVDVTLELTGPVNCDQARPRSRSTGPTARSRSCTSRSATARRGRRRRPKCTNGKDDDGDGMIDSTRRRRHDRPRPGLHEHDRHERGLRAADARRLRLQHRPLRRQPAPRRACRRGLRRDHRACGSSRPGTPASAATSSATTRRRPVLRVKARAPAARRSRPTNTGRCALAAQHRPPTPICRAGDRSR